ncbi:MAG: STAS domain-containing protein [Atopobiaceae bacterium]|jgi:anti-sigma B factor antagonist|nr:STAS domain-containing protein [Atopobiaceae bacterium]
MEIVKKGSAPDLTISVSGRLDTTTAPQLEAELKNSLEGVTSLVFDLSDLEYISSAGLRVLLSAQKRMSKQGTMVVRNVREAVMDVFEVTGFSDVLTIES